MLAKPNLFLEEFPHEWEHKIKVFFKDAGDKFDTGYEHLKELYGDTVENAGHLAEDIVNVVHGVVFKLNNTKGFPADDAVKFFCVNKP